ncbi:MAG: PIG-L family deacetylase [Bacteroidetes bacterium]|nr:PIG-L family deacetylase [Bacteroidota bacterium]
MKRNTILFLLLICTCTQAQEGPRTFDSEMFMPGYDIPAGVPHGTWDFDEWPGIDHDVVYVRDFMYGEGDGDKIKIDYRQNTFAADAHMGYLRRPETLARRFGNMEDVIQRSSTIMVLMAHPDDEVLLAGGLLATAAMRKKAVRVYLVSNGADASMGFSDEVHPSLGGYNCAGVMPDGSVRVATDLMGRRKPNIARSYGQALGVDISVLSIRYELAGRQLVQIGEYMGLDFKKSFGPGTVMRKAIRRSMHEVIMRDRPDLIITHGMEGEYGNYLHRTLSQLIREIVKEANRDFKCQLFTGYPEYNYSDRITHFLDLEASGGEARRRKHQAFKGIKYIYKPGNDYDKPWNPNDELMNGVFVKDYGYTPVEGKPPRYEYFQHVY